jgi:hypothetical protein
MVQALSNVGLWQALLRAIEGVQAQGNWRIVPARVTTLEGSGIVPMDG